MTKSREAWQRLYSKHGIQYGGSGDIGLLGAALRPGMVVLDAGCGDGKTTEVLARKAEVVACDFSREALVSLRHQRDRDMQANLVECELGHLPFEDEKFDAVACVHALSHLTERDRMDAAAELVRVLRPSGHILVEVFGKDDLRFGKGRETEKDTFLRGNGIMTHYFDVGEVRSLFGGMELVAETRAARRVSFGVVTGRRSAVKVLLKKPAAPSLMFILPKRGGGRSS